MESTLSEWAIAQDIHLIETLAWDGQSLRNLEAHLARLATSAQALRFPCDVARARSELQAQIGQAPARLRLTLNSKGSIALQSALMPVIKPIWRVGLAAQRLQSNDPWLKLKSSHRPAYDAARASLPAGLDEVILLNEHGAVCDGSITTVFFDHGAGMRTPPLSAGLLPGVLRAQMACPEETLYADQLPHVRLWVGNSLRGLIPARWID